MGQIDWRSNATYQHFHEYDAPGFAWEFLRRNPEFITDVKALSTTGRRLPTAAQKEAFAQKWGLRCHTP